MNNVSHKNTWNTGVTQVNVGPALALLTKSNQTDKSDLYEFNMALFDNGKPRKLFFVYNFNMTLAVSGTLETDANVQYLCTIFCGEALRQFDLLSDDIEGTNP